MTVFTGKDKIGDIVTRFPGASDIFKQYRIDFCCGGKHTLEETAQKMGIDEGEVIRRLQQAYVEAQERQTQETDWTALSNKELISHIVNRHHAFLTKELPLLSEYVTKILRVHGSHHPELSRLHTLFHQFKMEMEQHLIKEETMIFPLIQEYETQPSPELLEKIRQGINELEQEHTQAGDLLKEMRELTHDYQLPTDACHTYTVTFHKLEEAEADTFQHVHLENHILFPRFLK